MAGKFLLAWAAWFMFWIELQAFLSRSRALSIMHVAPGSAWGSSMLVWVGSRVAIVADDELTSCRFAVDADNSPALDSWLSRMIICQL